MINKENSDKGIIDKKGHESWVMCKIERLLIDCKWEKKKLKMYMGNNQAVRRPLRCEEFSSLNSIFCIFNPHASVCLLVDLMVASSPLWFGF